MFTTRSSSTLVPLKRPTLPIEKSGLSEPSELSDREKKLAIIQKYPLPDHWKAPAPHGILGRLHHMFFATMCLCAHGRLDMDFVWASIMLAEDGDENAWLEGRKKTTEQQNNILVLVSVIQTSWTRRSLMCPG
jgi:hypothetical protein